MYPTRVAARTTGEAASDVEAADRRAIERVLAGETAAYRAIVERHQRGVHAVIYQLTHQRDDADELTQTAFLQAYDALGTFDRSRRFSSWIYRIAVNLAKDHIKAKSRGEVPDGDAGEAGEGLYCASLPHPESSALASEREQLLERALASLAVADREVLVLKDLQELPYEEIKDILGRPVTALKIRVVRARAKLKAAIDALAGKDAL
jgi:RNA polymerase sigma-70 factor (ECF subfamily)